MEIQVFYPTAMNTLEFTLTIPLMKAKEMLSAEKCPSVTVKKRKNKNSALEYTLFDIFHNIYLLSILVLGESLPGGTKHPGCILKLNSFIESDRKKKEMEILNLPSLHV